MSFIVVAPCQIAAWAVDALIVSTANRNKCCLASTKIGCNSALQFCCIGDRHGVRSRALSTEFDNVGPVARELLEHFQRADLQTAITGKRVVRSVDDSDEFHVATIIGM